MVLWNLRIVRPSSSSSVESRSSRNPARGCKGTRSEPSHTLVYTKCTIIHPLVTYPFLIILKGPVVWEPGN